METVPAIAAKTSYPADVGGGPSIVRRWNLPGVEQVAKSLENVQQSLNILHKAARTSLTVTSNATTLGLPPSPTFAVAVSSLDPTVAEISGLTYADTTASRAVESATFSFLYVDPATPLTTLAANLGLSDATVTLTSATGISSGDFIQVGRELMLCGTPAGAVVPITRAQLGSLGDTAVSGADVFKLELRSTTAAIPLNFITSATLSAWILDAALPNMRLVAVVASLTNSTGNSPVSVVCVTDNVDHGIPLASTSLSLSLSFAGTPGQVGVKYPISAGLVAAGGIPAYTFSITAGSLPTGLSLDAVTGLISGTPTTAGIYSFTASVTDSASATVNKLCSIAIAQPSGASVIASITSLTATDDTVDRWRVDNGPLHAVVAVAVACSAYPQTVTIETTSPQYGRINHGWVQVSGATTIYIGAQNSNTAIYPPTIADETVTVRAAVGAYDRTIPLSGVTGSVPTTVVVTAPPVPAATAATGAYIDTLIVNRAAQLWGWKNLYTTLPFGDPNFKGARWTVQNGHYTNPVDPTTFVAGSTSTAQHEGHEVPFTDLSDNVYRLSGTNIVSIQNNNPSLMWTIPDYRLSDGSLNPDNVFRFRNLVASPLAATLEDDATWTYQNDWSSAVGVSTPGTAAYLDIVFDLSQGQVSGTNIDPTTLGDGLTQDGTTRKPKIFTGKGVRIDPADGSVAARFASSGGLGFDGSGNAQANLGYTMAINGSNQIVLSNLPAVFGLPSLPSGSYPQGAVILNTADSKVYRNTTGSAWVKSSDPTDLVAGAIASGVTLAAAQISAGTLAAGVVYAGQINCSQLNAGTISAAITLTSPKLVITSGTTTAEISDNPASMGVPGIAITDSSSNFTTEIKLSGIELLISGASRAIMSIIPGTGGYVTVYTGIGTNSMSIFGDGLYANLNKVVGNRQTGPGTASGWADSTAQSWANSLLTALRTHGLVT